MSKSALSAALQGDQKGSSSKLNALPLGGGTSSNLSKSAFPCLYQDASSGEDTFEVDVDLNLNKLSLGTSPGPASFRRRSLDDPVACLLWFFVWQSVF